MKRMIKCGGLKAEHMRLTIFSKLIGLHPPFVTVFFFPVVGGPVVLGGHGLLYQYVHSCWVD